MKSLRALQWGMWLLVMLGATVGSAHAASTAECNATTEQVFAQASQSVGRIFVMGIDPFDPYDKVSYSVGTGFFIDDQGTMITNYHVLLNAAMINISFSGGGSYRAKYIAGDPVLDIAILRIGDSNDRIGKALAFAADAPPAIGTQVYAIGHPLGLKISISSGIVSSSDVVLPVSTMSWDEPYIQTDAAINPGNSGGPLIDKCGAVVGMNSLSFPKAENIGFAIPARTLKMAAAELKAYGRIIRPWIGISGRIADPWVQDLARMPFEAGFMIETIEPGSAADKAGLRGGTLPMRFGPSNYILGGDIIKSVNGVDVTDLATTANIVRKLKPGDKITVEYFRNDEVKTLTVTLPERPSLPEDVRVLYRNVYSQPSARIN
ncbi:MAG: trypsin-like peptidase domain-containing protein [Rhizobiales bacterium]|nr:trypsin-like peptidase domain-containing protein [Hyphomicrobiales bacterium]MBI3672677.1 trypsin-like peptidase domain-containing protein [Hyphomicrobiales bacterium]